MTIRGKIVNPISEHENLIVKKDYNQRKEKHKDYSILITDRLITRKVYVHKTYFELFESNQTSTASHIITLAYEMTMNVLMMIKNYKYLMESSHRKKRQHLLR